MPVGAVVGSCGMITICLAKTRSEGPSINIMIVTDVASVSANGITRPGKESMFKCGPHN